MSIAPPTDPAEGPGAALAELLDAAADAARRACDYNVPINVPHLGLVAYPAHQIEQLRRRGEHLPTPWRRVVVRPGRVALIYRGRPWTVE